MARARDLGGVDAAQRRQRGWAPPEDPALVSAVIDKGHAREDRHHQDQVDQELRLQRSLRDGRVELRGEHLRERRREGVATTEPRQRWRQPRQIGATNCAPRETGRAVWFSCGGLCWTAYLKEPRHAPRPRPQPATRARNAARFQVWLPKNVTSTLPRCAATIP